MLEEGKKAPAFALANQNGDKVQLKDFRGKKLVLYFYPRDNTPGCTTEALGFRDAKKKLAALNAAVLGVSKDSAASHCKFIAKQGLDFDLLTDPDGATLESYGAWGEKSLYGKKSLGILRTTVVIDESGVVRKVFAKVRVNGHVEAVLEALAAL
jgi:peroxiredoxin Q/BCP